MFPSTDSTLASPERCPGNLEKTGFRNEVKTLILKQTAMALLGDSSL
jgi:hypothetical protein